MVKIIYLLDIFKVELHSIIINGETIEVDFY